MSQYLAEEARAADMTPLHEQMFGHALEPDPDFSCNGVETDYPGGPLVIEKSGADEAVEAVLRTSVWRQIFDAGLFASFPGDPKVKPAPDLSAITRDIARGG